MAQNSQSVLVLSHPRLHFFMARLRNKDSSPEEFRSALDAIAMHLCFAATEDIGCAPQEVITPLESMQIDQPVENVVAISVLRAGNGLLEPFLRYLPFARGGHIGLERSADATSATQYYCKVPAQLQDSLILVLDPMLATGGSASIAIAQLKKLGARRIRFVSVVACPEGVARLQKDHPDVSIVTAAMDRELNVKKYILPGLGDAGDRLYGTY